MEISKNLFKTLITFCFLATPLAAKTVGITQIVDHPSLNQIRAGIEEALQGEDITIVFENAQGNPTLAAQIAKKFQGLNLDAAVAITTPSAQALANSLKDVPLIFSGVSDPLAAKLVRNLKAPGGNITGVMDFPPIKEQLAFIQEQMPKIKTLGYLYNPGEANSSSVLTRLQDIAPRHGITILAIPVAKTSDIQTASLRFVERVDAIFIGTDNLVVSGLESLIKVTLNHKIPLFASDPDSVDRGALAAYAYAQKDIGIQTGKLLLHVLKGESPQDIPVEKVHTLLTHFNVKTAKTIGFTLKDTR